MSGGRLPMGGAAGGAAALSRPARALLGALDAVPAARRGRGLLLAVSGGPDSLALLLAASELRTAALLRERVDVATVDHRLRPDGAREARMVGDLSRELGLDHRTLVWRRGAGLPPGNLSAAARAARYALLEAEARRLGASLILAAHHADDQIETHLLLEARGARGAALAGMRPWRDLAPGLLLLRPFLDLSKHDLRAEVDAAGWRAVDDPSNRDPRFARARLRAALVEDAGEARRVRAALRDAQALRRLADRAGRARIAALAHAGRLVVTQRGEIVLTGGREGFDAALLARAVTAAGGGAGAPERAGIDRLARRIAAEGEGAATLAGCRVAWSPEGLGFAREYGRAGPPDAVLAAEARGAESSVCFDNRFDVALDTGSGETLRLVALGRFGRGGRVERTLPVLLDAAGAIAGLHPALRPRAGEKASSLNAFCRVGWRFAADLGLSDVAALTPRLQIAANRAEPVGKGLTDTYLRGQVVGLCVARRAVAGAPFQDG